MENPFGKNLTWAAFVAQAQPHAGLIPGAAGLGLVEAQDEPGGGTARKRPAPCWPG